MNKFRTLELAIAQYQQIKKIQLKGELRSQIERAAMSVCLNLSEGNARLKTSDRRRFFNISYASQKEVMVILQMSGIFFLYGLSDSLAAHLYRLQQNTR